MKKAWLSFAALTFALLLWATQASEKVFEIEISEVSDRSLFGGLGNSTGPIGEVTEFFVPELPAPLVDAGGLHAEIFKTKKIFIYKNTKYFICPQDQYNQLCLECRNCAQGEKFSELQRFDKNNREKTRKKELKKFINPTLIDQGANNIVEFQIPANRPKTLANSPPAHPLSLSAKHPPFGPRVEPLKQFEYSHSLSVLKSEDDSNFYLCPTSIFSTGCYVCIDCEKQLDQIKAHE